MPRPITIALTCGALALGGAFVAGCGGDDDKDAATATTPAGTPAATTGDATPGAVPAGAVTVLMQNNLFAPEEIKVKVGQTIHWVNNDPYDHNVRAKNGAFKSKNLVAKATFDYKAKKPGRIPYVCTIHSGQKGTVVVTR